MAKFSAEELRALRLVTLKVKELNTVIEGLHGDGYVMELELTKTKPGYPRVRCAKLLRRIGS